MAEGAVPSKDAAALALATELAKTLSVDEVPVKLRCAVCDKLAVNAFRFLCCEQNICETCNSSLSEQCPICAHSPLSPAKPLKSLRLTILAFVKNIEKKREKERLSAIGAETPATPVTPVAPPTPTIASTQAAVEEKPEHVGPGGTEVEQFNGATVAEEEEEEEEEKMVESVEQPVQPAEISTEPNDITTDKTDDNDEVDTQSQASDETEIFTGEEQLQVQQNDAVEQDQTGNEWSNMYNQGYGYNGEPNFQGMDFNTMQAMQQQMMQQVQNGTWNGFPNMMGMPGMNPMDMSGMFGGYGMQGMGGMNPNMMNGMMSGMMGMDFNGGYGSSWNNGQQLNGDFGASTGFYPGGGYNQSHQGHVPQMSQHQQYPKNNIHNQNRFLGSQRGHGRGGFYNQGRGQFHDQNFPQPPPNAPTGPKAAQVPQYNADGSRPLPEGYGRRPSQASASEPRPGTSGVSHDEPTTSGDNLASSEKPTAENEHLNLTGITDNELTQQGSGATGENAGPNAVFEQATESTINNSKHPGQQVAEPGSIHGYNGSQEWTVSEHINGAGEYGQQTDYNSNNDASLEHGMAQGQCQNPRGGFRGRGRGGFRGRGGWQYNEGREFSQPQTIVEPKGVGVEGAPTGPKALREGKPNTGWSGIARGGIALRGRGGFANAVPAAPASSSGHGDHREEKTANARARSPSRTPSRSRSQSRSRSRSRRRSHRRRSVTPSESEHERKRERRRHRSSRKREDADEARVEEHKDRDERKSHDRSRDDSEDDKYRSSRRDNDRRRSHRDTSKDRRRHRHRSRSASPAKNGDVDHDIRTSGSVNGNEVDSDRKRYRDKYRDRSRDRDREKDRQREKGRDKDRERDRDKDRDKKRSRRERSRSPESDHEHRSSRRSRREKERDKDRERERDRSRQRDAPASARSSQPHTPVEPEAEFKIQGRSKDRIKAPPTGPASMQPPTGPRNPVGPNAQIKKNMGNLVTTVPPTGPRSSAPTSSSTRKPTQPSAPTSTSAAATPIPAADPYEEERKKAYAERLRKEELRRNGPAVVNLGKKRSYSDALDEVVSVAPTGPKGDRKARGSRDDDGGRGKKSRRTSYKYEDDETVEQKALRVEREREASRWD